MTHQASFNVRSRAVGFLTSSWCKIQCLHSSFAWMCAVQLNGLAPRREPRRNPYPTEGESLPYGRWTSALLTVRHHWSSWYVFGSAQSYKKLCFLELEFCCYLCCDCSSVLQNRVLREFNVFYFSPRCKKMQVHGTAFSAVFMQQKLKIGDYKKPINT